MQNHGERLYFVNNRKYIIVKKLADGFFIVKGKFNRTAKDGYKVKYIDQHVKHFSKVSEQVFNDYNEMFKTLPNHLIPQLIILVSFEHKNGRTYLCRTILDDPSIHLGVRVKFLKPGGSISDLLVHDGNVYSVDHDEWGLECFKLDNDNDYATEAKNVAGIMYGA